MRGFTATAWLFAVAGVLVSTPSVTALSTFRMSCSSVTGDQPALRPEGLSGDSVEEFKPGALERMFNATKLTMQVKDTPDFLVTEREITLVRGGEEITRTVPEFLPNPDQRLRKYSAEIALANAVLKPADLKTIFAGVKAGSSLVDLGTDPQLTDRWKYFSRTRSGDWFGRFISGFKLTLSLSERPVPAPTQDFSQAFRQFLTEADEEEEIFALEFDPKYLFPTSADYSAAAAALSAYATTYRPGALGIGTARTEGPRGAGRLLAAALPTVKIETVDQFDFLEFGGRFLRSSLIEDSIEVYTLTWDLKRFLRLGADKLTDLGTKAALAKLTKPAPVVAAPPAVAIEKGKPVYWRLVSKDGVAPIAWLLLDSQCPNSDNKKGIVGVGLSLEGTGLVGGYPTDLDKDLRAGGCSFTIAARDAIGQNSRLACTIRK